MVLRRPAGIVVVVVALLAALLVPAAAGSTADGTYVPPVDAPISGGFDLPDGHYGRGNRGLDYATTPGTVVRASADGEVLFAGPVAGSLHVTILHADGLRTSYSFLASIRVRAGDRVVQGQPVGTSGPRLHLGVRDPSGTYLDPALLLSGVLRPSVRLVPGAEEGRRELRGRERQDLLDIARGAAEVLLPGRSGAPGAGEILAHYATELHPVVRAEHLVAALRRWGDGRDSCTPESVLPPDPPTTSGGGSRRILVLVAGFGSTSASAGVDRVDAPGLGYSSDDVIRFSYRGGRVPADGRSPGLESLPTSTYETLDSQQDLIVAADRLAELLRQVAAAEPGVPIDVVAHSQGGVVGRLAVLRGDAAASLPVEVDTLVTLSAPHGGADLATALHGMTAVGGGGDSIAALQDLLGIELDAGSPAVAELSEVAPLTQDLRDRGVPDQVHFVSVGARGDPVVANPRTIVSGEPSVVVDTAGLHAHDQMPGAEQTTREIALAIAGWPPTCSSLFDATLDAVLGESLSWAVDGLAAGGLVLTAPLP